MDDTARISPFDRPNSYIGRTLSRPGARRAVAGRGKYTDDFSLPRMVHAAFVRSPHAHARIVAIETAAAAAMPGVVLVMTGADLKQRCTGPWIGSLATFQGMKTAPQYPMVVDRACWQGEPVVMVVAESRAEAEDACECIEIEWEILPAAVEKEDALAPQTPVIHPELGDNLAFTKTIDRGAVDEAFAAAEFTVEETLDFGRHTAVSLEPRALLSDYDPSMRRLTVHASSACPHMLQTVLATTLDVPEHNVRLIAPDVGGSYGLKIHTFGDEVATVAASMVLGRPVKFVADRLESFVSDIHAREHRVTARMAVNREGEIQALEVDDLAGVGPYSMYPRTSVLEANQVINVTAGPYRNQNYRATATVVYLNKVPTSQYRAVGHPIGIAVGEHMIDRAAAAAGIDPLEIRRRNVMPDDGYPALTASGLDVKELSHQACLEKIEAMMDYDSLRREQAALREQGICRGIGLASFIKGTAPGPKGFYGAGGARIALQDACTLKLEPSGGVLCAIGVTEQGQGVETVLGQIAAATLGVPFDQIRVISGDTDAVPYGGGTYGSRATAIGGEAVYQAGLALRDEILTMAGILTQTDAAQLDIVDGTVVSAADGTARLPLSEIGRIGHFQLGELPDDYQPVLSVTRRFRLPDLPYIFTNGVHGAYVEVDTETGFIRLLRHWVVEDCGRVINPNLADEQVRGGCVQGLGGALYEHCLYDENGQMMNGSMADYLVPMAVEMPDIDVAHIETLTTESELGAKGAGESGTGPAPGVVMNAVNDALLPHNAVVRAMPMTPEVVLRALGKI